MIKHPTNNNDLVSDPIWFTYHPRKILLSNRIQNMYHNKARMNDDNLVLDEHEIHIKYPIHTSYCISIFTYKNYEQDINKTRL